MNICNCLKCITWTGCFCNVITSIVDICRGVKKVEEEIKEDIEYLFDYEEKYYICKNKAKKLYLDVKENKLIYIKFLEENTLD